MLRSIREEVGKRLNTQSIGLGEEVEHPKGSKLLIISRRWFPAPFWQGIIGSRPIFVSVVGGSPREYWRLCKQKMSEKEKLLKDFVRNIITHCCGINYSIPLMYRNEFDLT
jgi:hypothetical protein